MISPDVQQDATGLITTITIRRDPRDAINKTRLSTLAVACVAVLYPWMVRNDEYNST